MRRRKIKEIEDSSRWLYIRSIADIPELYDLLLSEDTIKQNSN